MEQQLLRYGHDYVYVFKREYIYDKNTQRWIAQVQGENYNSLDNTQMKAYQINERYFNKLNKSATKELLIDTVIAMYSALNMSVVYSEIAHYTKAQLWDVLRGEN